MTVAVVAADAGADGEPSSASRAMAAAPARLAAQLVLRGGAGGGAGAGARLLGGVRDQAQLDGGQADEEQDGQEAEELEMDTPRSPRGAVAAGPPARPVPGGAGTVTTDSVPCRPSLPLRAAPAASTVNGQSRRGRGRGPGPSA